MKTKSFQNYLQKRLNNDEMTEIEKQAQFEVPMLKSTNILLLASKSYSRLMLLTESQIPFRVIEQEADESRCDLNVSLEQAVQSIARLKMEHAIIPHDFTGQVAFVLTADTLNCNPKTGKLFGKPTCVDDVRQMLIEARPVSRVATAFCLHRKQKQNGIWITQDVREGCVVAQCSFLVPDVLIDTYVQRAPHSLEAAGGITIEGYGQQFLQSVQGSYATILGLPLFEVRGALQDLGFFDLPQAAQ